MKIIKNKELVNIFENANKKFLSENKNFILSDVSERSLCGTLSQYICSEIKKVNTLNIMLMQNTTEITDM